MTDLILAFILITVITAAATYIIKKKKSGVKCIGCPYAEQCNRKNCK